MPQYQGLGNPINIEAALSVFSRQSTLHRSGIGGMGGAGTMSASIACNEGASTRMRGDTTNYNSSVAGGIIGSIGGPDNRINSLVIEDLEFEDIELDKIKMPAI